MKKMFQENGYIFWERPEREGHKKSVPIRDAFSYFKNELFVQGESYKTGNC